VGDDLAGTFRCPVLIPLGFPILNRLYAGTMISGGLRSVRKYKTNPARPAKEIRSEKSALSAGQLKPDNCARQLRTLRTF